MSEKNIKKIGIRDALGEYIYTDIGVDADKVDIDASTNLAKKLVEIDNKFEDLEAGGYANKNIYGDEKINLGRKADTTAGPYSVTIGRDVSATGTCSLAEGASTAASGDYSHSEGASTAASGDYSHSEGGSTRASGDYSHSEGGSTTASGKYSHSEGEHTIASSQTQHVQGRYNVVDTNDRYAHIVGGGTFAERKNIHTLDWQGNAEFAGDVTAHGNDNIEVSLATIPDLYTSIFHKHKFGVSADNLSISRLSTDYFIIEKIKIYANNMFLVISKSNSCIMCSIDGLNWKNVGKFPLHFSNLGGIAYGNNKFVVTSEDKKLVFTSTDGIHWSKYSVDINISSITFGNGKFVAIGKGTTGNIYSSTDGVTWTQVYDSSDIDGSVYSIAYGEDTFVVTAATNNITGSIYTSTDGITWTKYTNTLAISKLEYNSTSFIGTDVLTQKVYVGTAQFFYRSTPNTSAIFSTTNEKVYDATVCYGNTFILTNNGIWHSESNTTPTATFRKIVSESSPTGFVSSGTTLIASVSSNLLIANFLEYEDCDVSIRKIYKTLKELSKTMIKYKKIDFTVTTSAYAGTIGGYSGNNSITGLLPQGTIIGINFNSCVQQGDANRVGIPSAFNSFSSVSVSAGNAAVYSVNATVFYV